MLLQYQHAKNYKVFFNDIETINKIGVKIIQILDNIIGLETPGNWFNAKYWIIIM